MLFHSGNADLFGRHLRFADGKNSGTGSADIDGADVWLLAQPIENLADFGAQLARDRGEIVRDV